MDDVKTENGSVDDVGAALKTAAAALETRTASQAQEASAASASATTGPAASSALPPEEIDRLTDDIVAALKTVNDPEIPSDIYELGLIYKVDIDDDRNVTIDMTLTAPGCPVAGEMPTWVENAVNAVPGVASTKVKLVFDPPWDQSRMSDEAKLAVGMF